MRPGPFFEMFLFALRALFFLGLRPALFRPPGVVLSGPAARAFSPSGHSASGGELFARPKSPPKTAPSGGPAGLCASLATLLGLSSFAPSSEGRGALCKTWGVSAVPFEATSKHTPHLQPSRGHSKQPRKIPFTRNPLGASLLCFPPARVAGHCAKYGTCQQCSLHSTSCLRHEAFKRPCANFALLHVNPQVDRKQCKVDTLTALYSRLLKAGGWPQKLLLTRPEFCTVSRDPRWRKTSEGSPKRVASEAQSPAGRRFF